MGLLGAEVADRLHEVGLAHPVGPEQHRGPRRQLQVGPAVGPEVRDGEVGQVHGSVRPPASGDAHRHHEVAVVGDDAVLLVTG
ncbi:Uncharacterised protein [Streptococcus pneumoniae]|nr:Uncharacterised protein [Streptococcus pneumoniae]